MERTATPQRRNTTMDAATHQQLVRGRTVVLGLLARRGYDVGDVQRAESADASLLERRVASCVESGDELNVVAAAKPGGGAVAQRAHLLYWPNVKSRLHLARQIAELYAPEAAEEEGEAPAPAGQAAQAEADAEAEGGKAKRKGERGARAVRPSPEDEVVVVLTEELPIATLTAHALTEWRTRRARLTLLLVQSTVLDPRDHELVPPHRRVDVTEEAAVLKALHAPSKAALQIIQFHNDAVARFMGLVPGDVVEIKRPSPTAGIATNYRVCV
jgi:DNA-directed RNA polymerase subunit H